MTRAIGRISYAVVAMIIAGTAAGGIALAAEGHTTVTAPRAVHVEQSGRTYSGIPIETVTLNREVGYADLDLKTEVGKDKLKSRIKKVAEEACDQLNRLYPAAEYPPVDSTDCVGQAVASAEDQVKQLTSRP